MYADRLTTVSPTYAQEIQTPAHGYGLEGVVQLRAGAVRGIRNGIETSVWNFLFADDAVKMLRLRLTDRGTGVWPEKMMERKGENNV